MPTMPAWLTHYHTVASCLDATHCPSAPDEPEMSEAVFKALVEGRLDEVEDQIEELPEWGQRPRPAVPLTDDPLRAIALAGLCRALPDSEAIAALTAVGAVTVLHCPPGGMTDDAASLLAAVLAQGARRPPVQIIALRLAADARAKDRASDALDHAMAAISMSTAPHVLLIEEGVALPGEIAAMLPAHLRIGPVDGWLIAAALGLRGGGLFHLVVAGIGVGGQMADIGDVDDMLGREALPAQHAPERIGKQEGAHVADMLIVIHRRPAGVDSHQARIDRDERLQRAREAVVEGEGRAAHCARLQTAPAQSHVKGAVCLESSGIAV